MVGREYPYHGMTLVEILIAIVISGVLAFLFGAIAVYTQEAWKRGWEISQVRDDLGFLRRTMEYQMRSATTYTFNPGEYFIVEDPGALAGKSVKFVTADKSINKYVRHRYYHGSDKTVVYERWYALTDPGTGAISYNLMPDESRVVLRDAEHFAFMHSYLQSPLLEAGLVQVSTDTPNGIPVIEISSFTVRSRNR